MDDLIRRQDVIEAIEAKQMPIMRSKMITDQYYFKGLSDALMIVEELPSAEPKQQWIPCSERLPDNQNIVLCSIPASGEFCDRIAFCYYTEFGGLGWRKSDWLGSIGRYGKMEPEPIAWMPLPKPYAEKETSKAYCTSMMDWCPYYEKNCRECEHNKKETKNGRP